MITVNIENFTGNELKCRCGCGRLNYDNEFLIRIQAFRYMLKRPMTVTSGGRCVKHNKEVGGEPTSCHECETKKATAIDFICNDLQQAYFLACDCGLFNEVIYYSKKGFIHLALDRKQKDNYFLIK
jgi:uncharacterized protein YcbK (DUF882 family)